MLSHSEFDSIAGSAAGAGWAFWVAVFDEPEDGPARGVAADSSVPGVPFWPSGAVISVSSMMTSPAAGSPVVAGGAVESTGAVVSSVVSATAAVNAVSRCSACAARRSARSSAAVAVSESVSSVRVSVRPVAEVSSSDRVSSARLFPAPAGVGSLRPVLLSAVSVLVAEPVRSSVLAALLELDSEPVDSVSAAAAAAPVNMAAPSPTASAPAATQAVNRRVIGAAGGSYRRVGGSVGMRRRRRRLGSTRFVPFPTGAIPTGSCPGATAR